VAVGTLSDTLIVALPGPNDEVNQCLDILVRDLESARDKKSIAENIAGMLRRSLLNKIGHPDKNK
jgi:molybdopterin biosynthesis enzyme MoaB